MRNVKAELTELEGAILSEIHDRGCKTAFQVRRAFQTSISLEWKGSTGAVYPAIRRLEAAGLVATETMPGGRQAKAVSLTPAGIEALHAWASNAERAASIGLDPFRLRSGIWRTFAPARRIAVLDAMAEVTREHLQAVERHLVRLDAVERPRIEMARDLHAWRLRWLGVERAAAEDERVADIDAGQGVQFQDER